MPPDIVIVAPLLISRPEMLVVPPCKSSVKLLVRALPEEVPKFAEPAVTLIRPLLIVEKFPLFNVPPLTHTPAVAGIVGPALNCAIAPGSVSLNRPLVSVRLPDMVIGPVASRMLFVSVPLLTVMLLNAVVEAPLIVLGTAAVLKLMMLVDAVNVPLFCQLPPMLCVNVLAAKVAPLLIVKLFTTVNAPPAVLVVAVAPETREIVRFP